jgi:hypothetical protein
MRVDLTELTGTQRFVVEALAAAHEGLSTRELTGLAEALGQRLTKAELDRAGQRLEELGWTRKDRALWLEHSTELIVRDLIDAGRFVELAARVDQILGHSYGPRRPHLLRSARRALCQGDLQAYQRALGGLVHDPLLTWVCAPLETETVLGLPPDLRARALAAMADGEIRDAMDQRGLTELLESTGTRVPLERRALLAGDVAREPNDLGLLALHHLMQGRTREASNGFAKALALARRTRGRDASLPALEEAFAPLAWILHGTAARTRQAQALLKRRLRDSDALSTGHGHLHRLLDADSPTCSSDHPVAALMEGLVRVWSQEPLHELRLTSARSKAQAMGWTWLAAELDSLTGGSSLPGCVSLRSHREALPAWELQLRQLEQALSPGGAGPGHKQAPKQKRVVWDVCWYGDFLQLGAREQTSKGTEWTDGRSLGKARLCGKGKAIPSMTEQDLRIAACLRSKKIWTWRGSEDEYSWSDRVWDELVGHPLLFDAQGAPIQVVRVAPRVELHEQGPDLVVTLRPRPQLGSIVTELPGAGFELTTFTPEQLEAGKLIGEGFRLPQAARGRLGTVLELLGRSFDMADQIGPERVLGEARPVVRVWPYQQGVRVQTGVRPAEGSALLQAGQGASTVLGRRGGRPVRVQRDLGRELELAQIFEHRCRSLAAAEFEHGQGYTLPALDEALELLEELQGLGQEVLVEWPEGQTLRVTPATRAEVSVRVESEGDWLEASGELKVDHQEVLALQELLRLVQGSHGRFIRLDEGRFVALTESARRQLDALYRAGQVHKTGVRVHPLAGDVLVPLTQRALDASQHQDWTSWRQRLSAAPADPPVPATLKAELRGYQVQGFHWLARLAALGVGACLADDMGLGKTVQTLALLLHRASLGPALVVAPTSVCAGWHHEAWRFAPTLRVRTLGSGDRASTLADLGPNDLLICSYGLLVTEQLRLGEIPWASLVLDEAQAIKNTRTRRHKAALRLKAAHRVTLSGTPVENRLEELYAQLAFLNPGFLGTQTNFRKRWARPITDGDRQVSGQLRKLVSPFLLRRTKASVLEELPPRTEVEMVVHPDTRTASFYEALRRNALESLDLGKQVGHIDVLAHMTRLRLAACSPRLVAGGPQVDGPKLAAFAEFVEQMAEGGHRALVFSQFVKHLSLLREWLDDAGVPYQYLDGASSPADRDRSVQAFQGGEGLVFLISLRAGGTGLNLTGADYVLHMDPWWNPAVEDQASDRAHRIGQTRAVTVYRMVTKGTIEEKIVSLHRQKRDLAEQLLGSQGAAPPLSAQELIELLRLDPKET